MSMAYDQGMIQAAKSVASQIGLSLQTAVYAGLTGPSLETPAEYNMLHLLGAGLVGMSTVPEVIAARHLDMDVLAFSVVSNVCFPPHRITETTIESVLKVAEESGGKLAKLICELIRDL